ncbi:hypothetical protein BGX27_002115, partial [Mortierella sp. AM989]
MSPSTSSGATAASSTTSTLDDSAAGLSARRAGPSCASTELPPLPNVSTTPPGMPPSIAASPSRPGSSPPYFGAVIDSNPSTTAATDLTASTTVTGSATDLNTLAAVPGPVSESNTSVRGLGSVTDLGSIPEEALPEGSIDFFLFQSHSHAIRWRDEVDLRQRYVFSDTFILGNQMAHRPYLWLQTTSSSTPSSILAQNKDTYTQGVVRNIILGLVGDLEVVDHWSRDPLPTPNGFEELYFPDYFAEFEGLPLFLVEIKKPGVKDVKDLNLEGDNCRGRLPNWNLLNPINRK